MPSVRSPQLWSPPALTELNVPGGGVDSPSSFLPQQATVASVRTAQVWSPPASTALNVPPAGVACPWLFEPQQASAASTLTAHECAPPALACTSAWALAGAASIDPTISAPTALRVARPIRASLLVVLGRGTTSRSSVRRRASQVPEAPTRRRYCTVITGSPRDVSPLPVRTHFPPLTTFPPLNTCRRQLRIASWPQ